MKFAKKRSPFIAARTDQVIRRWRVASRRVSCCTDRQSLAAVRKRSERERDCHTNQAQKGTWLEGQTQACIFTMQDTSLDAIRQLIRTARIRVRSMDLPAFHCRFKLT